MKDLFPLPMPVELPTEELIDIINTVKVLDLMAEYKTRTITIDYSPARLALCIPRLPGEETEELESYPLDVTPITFTLEDAMFGGVCFVALCVGHRVLIQPFVWTNFEAMRNRTVTFHKAK